MPLASELIVKPPEGRNGRRWKGTLAMQEDAETVWEEDFLHIVDELPNMSAIDLVHWVGAHYKAIGYANIGRMFIQAERAHAKAQMSEPA